MRIVLLSDWFSEKMGYSHNFLPAALARLGHDVHLVTSNGQVYFTNRGLYQDVFERFLGPGLVATGVTSLDGFTLHRLPATEHDGTLTINDLTAYLARLRPDVVSAGEYIADGTLEAARAREQLGYKLFVECHVHASVFPVASGKAGLKERFRWWRFASTMGRFISRQTEKCYPISTDAADIAVRFFGMEKHKIAVQPLGVETRLFKPAADDASRRAVAELRARLGFSPDDIVCIYTGRLSRGKGTWWLAEAVEMLVSRGERFKALFVGGSEGDRDGIGRRAGCVIHPFVLNRDLPIFYQAADIGVWPREESTSQIDAAACGLPLVLSDHVKVLERVDGNGLLYEEGNVASLAARLMELRDSAVRQRMGARGAANMEAFSWDAIAAERSRHFESAARS